MFELQRPKGPIPPARAAYPDGYRFRPARPEEAAACSRVTGIPVAENERRFAAGDACYVVERDGLVVLVQWVHDGPCYVRGLGYVHDGAPDERYVYGVVTDPAHRGRGLFRNALEHLDATLFSEGASRLVQIVMAGNTPVLKTFSRLGYRATHDLRSVLVLGVRWTVVTPVGRESGRRSWRIAAPPGRFVI